MSISAQYSRLISQLSNSKLQQQNNALYQVIKELIDAATSFKNGVNDNEAAIAALVIPDPSDSVATLDGTNDSGTSLQYSRGDHKHDVADHALTLAKLPTETQATLLGRRNGSNGNTEEITLGTNLSMTNAGVLNAAGAGDVVGPGSAVDEQVALFDGTTGKLIKAASLTGIAYVNSGVLKTCDVSVLTNGDPVSPELIWDSDGDVMMTLVIH